MITIDDITSGMAIEPADSADTIFSARLSEMPGIVARLNREASRDASALVDRWIREEQQYRAQVAEARVAGTPYACMMGHADGIAWCRRMLQR